MLSKVGTDFHTLFFEIGLFSLDFFMVYIESHWPLLKIGHGAFIYFCSMFSLFQLV